MLGRLEIVLPVSVLLCASVCCKAADRQTVANGQEGKDAGQAAAAVPEFSIRGTVVDSAAGTAVGHALVVLSMYGDPKTNTGEQPMVILWIYPSDRVTRTFADTGETVEHLSEQDMMGSE